MDNDLILKSMGSFLRNLANNIENNTLSNNDIKKLFEFYIKFKFDDNNNNSNDYNLKYFTLGWYIYNNLLQNDDL
jgi:hypothetical protein